jgi:hypothetical protein
MRTPRLFGNLVPLKLDDPLRSLASKSLLSRDGEGFMAEYSQQEHVQAVADATQISVVNNGTGTVTQSGTSAASSG